MIYSKSSAEENHICSSAINGSYTTQSVAEYAAFRNSAICRVLSVFILIPFSTQRRNRRHVGDTVQEIPKRLNTPPVEPGRIACLAWHPMPWWRWTMLIAKYRKPARNRLNQCVVCNKDFQRGLPAWVWLPWSWQPAPTNEDRIQRREDLRTVPNKRQHAAINTSVMISPQRPRMMYTINLTHRFGLCRENVSLALKIYFLPAQIPTRNLRGATHAAHAASMVLYRSSACWLPGLPSTNSRPSTLNLKCPRLCNRGFGNVPCLRQPIRKPSGIFRNREQKRERSHFNQPNRIPDGTPAECR